MLIEGDSTIVPCTETVIVAEGTVVVPPLLTVTSVVLCSVVVLESYDQDCPERRLNAKKNEDKRSRGWQDYCACNIIYSKLTSTERV